MVPDHLGMHTVESARKERLRMLALHTRTQGIADLLLILYDFSRVTVVVSIIAFAVGIIVVAPIIVFGSLFAGVLFFQTAGWAKRKEPSYRERSVEAAKAYTFLTLLP